MSYTKLLIVLSTSIIFSTAFLSKEYFHFISEQVGAKGGLNDLHYYWVKSGDSCFDSPSVGLSANQ